MKQEDYELIKESNGWKLYKHKTNHKVEIETPEGFRQTMNRMLFTDEEFNRIVSRGWIWLDREYFIGRIKNSKIEIEKRKKQIQSDKNDLFIKSHWTSEEEAMKKLKPILIKANQKFKTCKERFIQLQSELDFNVGYTMKGDTHGIYEDFQHINFHVDRIFCIFQLEN